MTNNKKTILIIEDEKLISNALKKKLELEEFSVLVSEDGEQGVADALEKHPDLILLDIVLPKKDGISVLESLRNDSWGGQVPIIILTNLSKAETVEESRKMGVNTYLVKTDWKLDEVVQKVKYELGIL